MPTDIRTFAVFAWLPVEVNAVPAGPLQMVERDSELLRSTFRYGRRYLARANRIELDPLTLAFSSEKPGEKSGEKNIGADDREREPPRSTHGLLHEFGVFRDAAPDLWGRRLIENKLRKAGPLRESEYIEHAGSNRTGALDFRAGPDLPERPGELAQYLDLQYLQEAAERIDAGLPIPARLEKIFEAGPSMGGARPKAVIETDGRQWLAKFSGRSDRFDVPRVEYATLRLARAAGLNVPEIRVENLGEGRHALLIERFDRVPQENALQQHGYARRHFMSALSMLGRHESESPHASYADISQAIATHGVATHVRSDQRELFARMVFNILVSNNDDHLRNHGFLYAEKGWRLSPLYDVVPVPAIASERHLHLSVGKEGRLATLTNALSGYGVFGLTITDAANVIDRVVRVVREWRNHFEEAGVPGVEIDRVASAFRNPRDLGGDEIARRIKQA